MKRRTLAALSLAGLAGLAALSPTTALASSHSEAPGTSKDRLTDDTDLYAWVAADATGAVTIVGNWVPLIEPNSGPNFASFDDDASYYINVDNVGDSRKHLRYELTFHTTRQNPNTFLYNTGVVTSLNDPDLNVRQAWTLTRVDEDAHTETPPAHHRSAHAGRDGRGRSHRRARPGPADPHRRHERSLECLRGLPGARLRDRA